MATGYPFTQVQSGVWASGATWGNPGSTEGVDYPYYSTYQSDITGTITVSSGYTLTLSGNTYLGGRTDYPVYLVLEAGSTITDGGSGYTIYRSQNSITTTATTGSWANVAGALSITHNETADYLARSRKLVTKLEYVSFTNTGTMYLGTGKDYGVLTPEVDIQHCTFTGCGDINFGYGGYNTLTPVTVGNCDFRSCGTIGFRAGQNAGTNTFINCTLKDCMKFTESNINNVSYSGTVFYATPCEFFVNDSSGIINTLAIVNGSTANTGGMISGNTFQGNASYNTILNNSYAYVTGTYNNWHGHCDIKNQDGNIYEINIGTTYEPNIIGVPNNGILQNCIITGVAAAAFNIVGDAALTGDTVIKHNTIYCTGSHVHSGVLLAENGEATGANITFQDNLAGFSTARSLEMYHDNDSPAQTIYLLNKNAYYNCSGSTKLDNVTVTTDSDFNTFPTSLTPSFVDPTRGIISYSDTIGGDSTESTALAMAAAINGYNSTTKTQSDSPSGFSISDLLTHVRNGFAPTEVSLQGAASDSGDIGAVAVSAATGPTVKVYNGASFDTGILKYYTGATFSTATINTYNGGF